MLLKNNTNRVLIAPLDWGLGHATRCIPIVNELLAQKVQVWIAGEESTLLLLKKEFPDLDFLHLKGYRIQYSRKKNHFLSRIALQFPKILSTYLYEKRWLRKAQKQYHFNAVISDNRPGLIHPDIPCIYMTHQLQIKTGTIFFDSLANKFHHFLMRKFREWWVPDAEENGLSGALGHPPKKYGKVRYLGPVSRMGSCWNTVEKYELLCLLSGPEPQRTIFETLLLREVILMEKKTLFVRGLPSENRPIQTQAPFIEFKNHLPAKDLNLALCAAETIISRCGYTTVMDLAKINKPAILVPTPGQMEQKYLAKYLSEKSYFLTVSQEAFSLTSLLEKKKQALFAPMEFDFNQYKSVVTQLVSSIK